MEKIIVLLLMTSLCNSSPTRERASISGCRPALKYVGIQVRSDNIIDLTYDFDETAARWPSITSSFDLSVIFKGLVTAPFHRYFLEHYTFSSPEHAGTHMDAPSHFSQHNLPVDKVPLQDLVGRGVLVDLVKGGQRFGRDSKIAVQDILDHEAANGRIRSRSIVLFRTGYGDVYANQEEYWGTNLNSSDAEENLHFPGLDEDAAEWLVSKRCISAVGIDTPSPDYGQAKGFPTHKVLTSNKIPIFENVANLGTLQTSNRRGFNIIALPYKIKGGSGGPIRIIAVLR